MAVMSRPAPRPWMQRPATSWAIDDAVPETARPAMNETRPATIGRRGPRASLTCPETTMPTTLATRKPVNAQPIAPRPCTSRAAVGSAAATAIASKAIIVIRIRIPPLVLRCSGAKMDRVPGGRSTAALIRPACKLKPGSGQPVCPTALCSRQADSSSIWPAGAHGTGVDVSSGTLTQAAWVRSQNLFSGSCCTRRV